MSKTDKDRPFWVQNQEHGRIDHDHRHGKCIVSDDLRDRWPAWRSHYRNCNKRVERVRYCDKTTPETRYVRGSHFRVRICWVWECECPNRDEMFHRLDCENRTYVECIGHSYYERDESIPCSCDDRPEPATCFPAWDLGRHYSHGGVPTWYVRQVYHRPERARERKLNDYVREYNTYGELEDGDFDNRQARNSARWLWW